MLEQAFKEDYQLSIASLSILSMKLSTGCGIIIYLKEINDKTNKARMDCTLPRLPLDRKEAIRPGRFQARSEKSY
jgi:hypothetical protein